MLINNPYSQTSCKMPRSNKKKFPLKPPIDDPIHQKQKQEGEETVMSPKKKSLDAEDIEDKTQKKSQKDRNIKISEDQDFQEMPNTQSRNITKEIKNTDSKTNDEELCYILKNEVKEFPIKNITGKMECPKCQSVVKNLLNHFEKNIKCGDLINMEHFRRLHEIYTKQKRRDQSRIKMQNLRARKMEESKESLQNKQENKIENQQKMRDQERIRMQKLRTRKREEIKESLHKMQENNTEYQQKMRDKARIGMQNVRTRKKEEGKESLHNIQENNTEYQQKMRAQARIRMRKLRARKREESTINGEEIEIQNGQVERLMNFNKAVIFGPIFICSCCSRKLYENGVTKITSNFIDTVKQKKQGLYGTAIPEEILIEITLNGSSEKTGYYICHTCRLVMKAGKIPSMSVANGLQLVNIEEDCHLTELENNLIAQNINFQYIFCLQKSRWAATRKQMISVPVTPEAVLNTVQILPRLPRQAGLVELKLKRKKEYERSHKKEFVDPEKIMKVLLLLKNSGNPYYQFDNNLNDYEQRCKDQDVNGHQLLFGDDTSEKVTVEERTESEKDSESSSSKPDNKNLDCTDNEDLDSNDEEITYVTKDPIRKHQFDHNRNTCLTNNYPEMFTDESGKIISEDKFSFAPAEGNHPYNILDEKDWDVKSWPALHPDGKFGISHERKVRLTDQQYFGQRILNHDTRFSKSPGYIFAAAAYIEQKQLSNKANISYMRGKKTVDKDGVTQFDLNDAFTIFDGIKNTPKYWQNLKYDMIAKLENFGPFHLFFTLSCGDTRYQENFSSFLVENGYMMEYLVNQDGTPETIVKKKEKTVINKPLEQFLLEDIDESLHEMIRTNVLTATRNFQHRVDAFKKEVLMQKNNPMKIKMISYRVEFQGRGAAHIHGTLWLDLEEIEKSDHFSHKLSEHGIEKGLSHLSEAFRKFRDKAKLNETEKYAIAIFVDMFISCSLNSNTVGRKFKMDQFGKLIVEIAISVNSHHHTKSCKKYEDKCRYGFPKFPLKETLVVDKNEFNEEVEEANQTPSQNYTKILSDIEDVLNDEVVIMVILKRYPKGNTEEEYDANRSKRIDDLLEIAGGISYEIYIMAIKKTRTHGSTILLQRDLDEIFVNHYNPEWLVAWNSNLDIQPVMDYFAIITYVTDYWAKADQGVTPFLKEAAENLKTEPDQKKRSRQMASTFLTHRQMGEAEAYFKIFPNLTLKYSNVDTIFIPSDKKELRSKFLMKLAESGANFSKGVEVKGGRDGMFLEKPDIIKYK